MVAPCPVGYVAQQWDPACGVHRCCNDIECLINVNGVCVCATYIEPSPSNPDGEDYSFIAKCSNNQVSTSNGVGCETFLGLEYAWSCYCRLKVKGDVGKIGDTMPGNAIFNSNDQCTLFKAQNNVAERSDETVLVSRSNGGSIRRSKGFMVLLGQILVTLLVVQMLSI